MKLFFTLSLIAALCVLILTPAWAGDLRFGGGSSRGHFGGNRSPHFGGSFHRGPGSHGPFTNYGSPAFRSPEFHQSQKFRSQRRSHFHSHRRPFAHYNNPWRHRTYKRFPKHDRFYSYHGAPHSSYGFTRRRFGTGVPFAPAGPPPIGAVGPSPFVLGHSFVIRYPFFCNLHGFGYRDQHEFYAHLNFAHRVPLDRAASYCHRQGDVVIFFGY